MSIHVLSAVLKHSQSKLGARLVLVAIADRADDHGVAWPRPTCIQRDANLSERQTREAIRTLVDLGELEVIHAPERQYPPLFRILVGAASPAKSAADISAEYAGVTGRIRRCHRRNPPVHREPSREPSEEPKPLVDPGIDQADRITVWEAYRAYHPAARLTSAGKNPRTRIIDRALRDYPVDTLVAAIRGNHEDPHCNGQNDRGRSYHGLELILRDADHIERFAAIHEGTEREGRRLSMDEVNRLAEAAGWPGAVAS